MASAATAATAYALWFAGDAVIINHRASHNVSAGRLDFFVFFFYSYYFLDCARRLNYPVMRGASAHQQFILRRQTRQVAFRCEDDYTFATRRGESCALCV